MTMKLFLLLSLLICATQGARLDRTTRDSQIDSDLVADIDFGEGEDLLGDISQWQWRIIGNGVCRSGNPSTYTPWGKQMSKSEAAVRSVCAAQSTCLGYWLGDGTTSSGNWQVFCSSMGGICNLAGKGGTSVTSVGGYGGFCMAKKSGGVACTKLSTLAENNFNNRGDTTLNTGTTYTYMTSCGYTVRLSGWSHTRKYAKGFLRNSAGTGKAVVEGLKAGKAYNYKIYQYASAFAGTNPYQVNGVSKGSTTSAASDAATATGTAVADGAGKVTFTFTRQTHHIHLSGIAIAEGTPSRSPTRAPSRAPSRSYAAGKTGEDACPTGYRSIKDTGTCKTAAEQLGYKYYHKTSDLKAAKSLCNYCGGCPPKYGSKTVRVDSTHGRLAKWICMKG